MKVNRKNLMSVLQALRPGLAKQGSVVQLAHFISTGKEIITFSGKVCIRYPFDLFPFCVPGDEFYKILDKMNDETIEISEENHKLHIVGANTEAVISTLLEDDDLVVQGLEAINTEISTPRSKLPEDFISAVFFTMFSTSRDASSAALNCIYFTEDNAMSTDNSRASWYIMKDKVPEPFLLAQKSAEELVKFPNINEVVITKNWAHFFNPDGVTFSCTLVKSLTPNIPKMFENADEEGLTELPKTLRDIINDISFLATEDKTSKYVTVSIDGKGVMCKAERELGWIKKKIEWKDYTGEPITFFINSEFFGQILEKTTFMKKIGRIVFFSTENFYHLIGLAREKANAS